MGRFLGAAGFLALAGFTSAAGAAGASSAASGAASANGAGVSATSVVINAQLGPRRRGRRERERKRARASAGVPRREKERRALRWWVRRSGRRKRCLNSGDDTKTRRAQRRALIGPDGLASDRPPQRPTLNLARPIPPHPTVATAPPAVPRIPAPQPAAGLTNWAQSVLLLPICDRISLRLIDRSVPNFAEIQAGSISSKRMQVQWIW